MSFSTLDEALIANVMETTGLSREDAEIVCQSSAKSGPRHEALKVRWVLNLDSVTRAIVAETARPLGVFATVFWIRLYGVLTELRADWQRTSSRLNPGGARTNFARDFLTITGRIAESANALHAAFTADELILIEFTRHTQAHPTQKGFYVALEGKKDQKKSLRKGQFLATLGKHLPVAEIQAKCEAMHAAYGNDDLAILRAFAGKAKEPLNGLQFNVRSYAKLMGMPA